MESKIDFLAHQLSSSTLHSKQGQTAAVSAESPGRDYGGVFIGEKIGITCSFCRKPGHGTYFCSKNPHRGKKCKNCGKTGHGMETCWTKEQVAGAPFHT